MPSLSDIFNPSFFMCLGILVLLTALIVVYFESKMREQNHKIASMLSLVSSLAEEQNNLRMETYRMITSGQNSSANSIPLNNVNNFNSSHFINKNENDELINVSDDDDDDEEDDDSDNEDSDEEDEDSDSDDENDDSDSDENEVIEISENDIKILKINIKNDDEEDNFNIHQIDDLEELGENDDESTSSEIDENELDDSSSSDEDLKEEHIVSNNLDNLEESKDGDIVFEETSKLDLNTIDFKQISISGLEKDAIDAETMDYKKFSLNKLKSVVVEKGLIKDSSKLKKNELLNLLGVK
jgi:hypothetical protein